jgi:hypothetical protein
MKVEQKKNMKKTAKNAIVYEDGDCWPSSSSSSSAQPSL